ncbi:MAG: hypothetical protein U9R19_01145 [Bacteroidota bacterium]|nr:hypothetical protein [Bacteroidota bacterium]
MRKPILPAFLIFLLPFFACQNNELRIDTSDINLDIEINRIDNDLFNIDTTNVWEEIHRLSTKYDPFWDLYTYRILNIGGTNDRLFADRLLEFINDPVILESYSESQNVFGTSQYLKEELTSAFKHYLYYFPEKKIPEVYTYIGGFNQSVVTDENLLGIGLDKYLGDKSKFYYQLQFPNFARKKLIKENIAIDCMRAWATMEFPYNDSIDNVLNTMIYFGRQLHFLKAMLPEKHDSAIIRFSYNDLKYCINNEKEMYAYLIEHKFLYSSKFKDIKRFTNDGPFTSGFKNSPARVGNWIGWQIVRNYLKHNSDEKLDELMQNGDYQEIFIASKYNP